MSPSPEDKPYTLYSVKARKSWSTRRKVVFGLVALLLVVAAAAGGGYLWLGLTLGKANGRVPGDVGAVLGSTTSTTARATGGTQPTQNTTTVTIPPKPDTMNILLLGSDKRPEDGSTYGRSDTMMIVHVDPSADFVSVLSLPRDLEVDLSQYGTQKLNAAYAFGGDKLAITTVRDLTGLQIDHYVNMDFAGFTAVTQQLGGIYVDVDRRYMYVGPDYERIDIQPGYQRLAGDQALEYVRYRHDSDSDWGRMERQQRFLRAAKEQVLTWNMAVQLPGTVSLFMDYVTTEIHPLDVLKLAWYGAKLDLSRIKTVTLEGRAATIGGISYVVASQDEINTAVKDFLTPPAAHASGTTTPASGSASTTSSTATGTSTDTSSASTASPASPVSLAGARLEVQNATGRSGEAATVAKFLEQSGADVIAVRTAAGEPLGVSAVVYPADHRYDSVSDAAQVAAALGIHKLVEDESRQHVVVFLGKDFVQPASDLTQTAVDAAEWRYFLGAAGFPLQSPTWLPKSYAFAGSRVYNIDTASGPQPALKVTYRLDRQDQYLGLMETKFVDAPAAATGEQVTAGGTTFTVVTAGSSVDRVWWKRDGVLYWVSNTLAFDLDRAQMLKVAESMVPAT